METTSVHKEKQRIIGVYVIKVCDGKIELVEERDGKGFGPIGGRMSYMDERDSIGLRGVLAREYVAETNSVLSRSADLIYIGVFFDETEKYRYENNLYMLMDDSPLTRKKVKQFEVKQLFDKTNGPKLRHWFDKMLMNDVVRNELLGIAIRNGIKDMGIRCITSLTHVYVFPEHNPGITHIYRIGVESQETEQGMITVYTPKRVTWKIVDSDVSKSSDGLRYGLLVPKTLDQLRNKNINTNVLEIIKTLPSKEGEDSELWMLFPLHEYYSVGA
jgi:hypothetical protein